MIIYMNRILHEHINADFGKHKLFASIPVELKVFHIVANSMRLGQD